MKEFAFLSLPAGWTVTPMRVQCVQTSKQTAVCNLGHVLRQTLGWQGQGGPLRWAF